LTLASTLAPIRIQFTLRLALQRYGNLGDSASLLDEEVAAKNDAITTPPISGGFRINRPDERSRHLRRVIVRAIDKGIAINLAPQNVKRLNPPVVQTKARRRFRLHQRFMYVARSRRARNR
jgi:hypothetical protein